eukprot:TRINITY_DN12303_c0_g1_i2.p1 TRINITY_DN12303_c0_g1~~TRINITY_DN12303_c0_g1_i2.p1  ORF type:complete len:771 (+),score=156.87 TRINITY_DN12303_c0_g1_i2:1-2313(+)
MVDIGKLSIASQVLLTWCTPLVFRPPQALSDLPSLPSALTSASVPTCAHDSDAEPPTVVRIVWNLHKTDVLIGLLSGIAHGLISTALRSYLLFLLVEAVADSDSPQTSHWVLVAALAVVLLVEGLASTVSKHWLSDRLGIAFFQTGARLIQRSALRKSSQELAVGQLSASELVGLDLVRALENGKFLAFLPMGIAQIVGGTIMILWLLGVAPGLTGIGTMLLIITVNFRVASWVKKAEASTLTAADARLSLMKQFIFGVQAVKLSAWEEPFSTRITQERATEESAVRRKRFLEQITTQVGRACPIIGAGSAFLYLGLDQSADWEPSRVFAALSVFHAMRMGVIMVPQSVAIIGAVSASTARIDSFLALHEPASTESPLPDTTEEKHVDSLPLLEGATLAWDQTNVLFDINLRLARGEITAVCGEVGSGKSSLLYACCGELNRIRGIATPVTGKVAYVPQVPFIVSGSIKDNVLMGRELNEHRMQSAIQRSQMGHDLKLMAQGLDTVIGERGQTLSGGQKARICIARAFYEADLADLFIADDCLAAVDPRVATAVFEELKALTPQCTVLLTLNQLHLARRCDQMITMKEGRISSELTGESVLVGEVDLEIVEAVPQGQDAPIEHKAFELKEDKEPNEAPVEPTTPDTDQDDTSTALGKYVTEMGPWLGSGIFVCLLTYTFMLLSDRWIALWIDAGVDADTSYYARVYGLLCTGFLVCAVCSSLLLSEGGVRAGRGMHTACLDRLVHAPLEWFEATSCGRILSRKLLHQREY